VCQSLKAGILESIAAFFDNSVSASVREYPIPDTCTGWLHQSWQNPVPIATRFLRRLARFNHLLWHFRVKIHYEALELHLRKTFL
jgi:hypothetical protein